MLSITEIITLLVIIGILCILYKKYENKYLKETYTIENKDLVRRYLLNENKLTDMSKPIIWIYIPYEYNSRNWINFGSRSSCELNQPYLYLTLKSIIMNCERDFNIVIIDDNSFSKLIPDWNINMNIISEPIKGYIKHLGILTLLYTYGGMVVPLSFLCLKGLQDLYMEGISGYKMFVCENIINNIKNTYVDYYPDINMMGTEKENPIVKEYIEYIKIKISKDYTQETNFLGDFDVKINKYINNGLVNKINGKYLGIKDMDNNPILVDNWMSEEYIKLYDNAYGIIIPSKEILNRIKYEYYARLSIRQVLESKCILSKYIVLAISESMVGEININFRNGDKRPNNWIGWWKTDLNPPLWGMKPLMVAGNDKVQMLNYPEK